jgi:predicted peptidase
LERAVSFFLAFSFALAAAAQTVDPHPPLSAERRALIDALRQKAEAVTPRFAAAEFTGSDGRRLPYRLFRPAKLLPGRKYPLVLYLHGAGGLGRDNRKNYTGGNLLGSHVWAIDENQARYPAFVAAPQTEVGWGPRSQGAPSSARSVLELLDKLSADFPVDPERVYVTGQSMGGYGTWFLAMFHPERFAAAVPVCGRGIPEKAAALRALPLWNFHGAADKTVPITYSREMLEAVRKAGGKPLATEYEGVGHNSWEWAYSEPALPAWLFSHVAPAK